MRERSGGRVCPEGRGVASWWPPLSLFLARSSCFSSQLQKQEVYSEEHSYKRRQTQENEALDVTRLILLLRGTEAIPD